MNLYNQIVAIDIGNSQIKFGSIDQFEQVQVQNFQLKFSDFIAKFKHPNIYISTVNSINFQIVQSYLNQSGLQFQLIEQYFRKQNLINLTKVQGTGSDRILSLFGARQKFNSPILTVDCGTALTLNYLDKHNMFKGGAILPGLYSQLNAINSLTDKINIPDINKNIKFPANNTRDAVSTGILMNLVGAINLAIETITLEDLSIVITGGYSQIIYELIKKEKKFVVLENFLVCKGIIYLAEIFNKIEND